MQRKTLGIAVAAVVVVAGLWAAQRFWLGELPAGSSAGGVATTLATPVPDLALPDRNNTPIHLRDFRGKVLVINFWATWCLPCKVEIPFFNQVYEEYRARGVEFLGISVDAGGWRDIDKFQKEVPLAYPVVLADEAKVSELFGGLPGLPVTIYVARDGRMVHRHLGITDIDDLRANIQKLL